MQRSRSILGDFLGVTALAFALYLPFLSINYDLNGIYEARAVDSGAVDLLLHQNHLLGRPLGWLIFQGLRFSGFEGSSLSVLQIITALCGALGIGFAYLFFYSLGKNRFAAFVASLWLATSWAYWYFSTDTTYITLAAMLVAGTLALCIEPESNASIAIAGTIAGLAVLAWQSNIVLIPILGLLALLIQREGNRSFSFAKVGILFTACFSLVSIFYYGLGAFIYGLGSPRDLLRWLFGHGGVLGFGSVGLPMWGQWNPARFLPAGKTALESILPLNTRPALGEYVGFVEPSKTFFWLSLAALVLLASFLMWEAIRKRPHLSQQVRVMVWLLSAYALYIFFIVWWDPYEAKWYVIPNLFLGALIVRLCNREFPLSKKAFLLACVLTIAIANFASTIWPRHSEFNRAVRLARCVSSEMNESDLFLATDWSWVDYMIHLHNRRVISVISLAAYYGNKKMVLDVLHESIRQTQQDQSRVYRVDFASYQGHHIDWLRAQTGFTASDLSQWGSTPAYVCDGIKFLRLGNLTGR